MKEKFLSKWSNWWSLTRDAKQLNMAFAKELNELIENEVSKTAEKPHIGSNAYVHGVLQACEFLEIKYDEPTQAANIIRDELVNAGFCTLKFAKSFSKSAGLRLNKVWKESCLRGLS